MTNTFVRNDDEVEEPEELNDEDATLADDLLDEVAADDLEEEEVMEGFGILSDKDVAEETEEKEDGDDDEDAELEDDAEDVDFDTFDDVDEL